MPSINKIDHINICVTDLEKAKTFFTDLLDFRVETEGTLEGEWIDKVVSLPDVKAKYAKLTLPDSDTALELIQYYNPVGTRDDKMSQANRIGFRHMALEVTNIEAVYERLKNAGVHIFSELQIYNGKKKLCYFHGPDDIILELAEYR